ncbi:MAG: VWA domain-containing protein [Firmicutes bacterium]|nr:VWA domain-containing protein [Bacillota bacterium]
MGKKIQTSKFRKVLSLLLVFALLAAYMPETFGSSAYASAGPSDGQVEYEGGKNSTEADATYDIEISKTIKAVEGKENYFDITLEAITHKHKIDMSTDVIIVMDISNTMNTGNKLQQAKNATKQFVKQFCEDTEISSDRKLGIVTFNTNAQVAVSLQKANSTKIYTSKFEQQINNITAPADAAVKYTNIEAGLQLAKNILSGSSSKHKFVILLTDGFPTTYIKGGRTSTTKINGYSTYTHENNSAFLNWNKSLTGKKADGTLKNLGYMANIGVQKTCTAGVDYSDYGAQRAEAVANEMKSSGYNIFSVGIGIGGMTIQEYLNKWKNSTFSTVDTNGREGSGNTYTIGNASNTDSYKNWLGNDIAGGALLPADSRYSAGDNANQLKAAYTKILNTIELAPETTMRTFYTLDPMSDVAEFIGFYNKDGKLASTPRKLTGQSKLNAENTATYGVYENKEQIHWDMMKSGFRMDGQNYVYTLKYRVRLMNEASGFQWKKAYDMNKETTLNYSQKYVESGENVPGGSGTMKYPIPETEGYKGTLKFKKIDGETNAALKDVQFTLKHYGDSCNVCSGDAVISEVTEKSDSNGYVEFDNIPSGHEYYLIEKAPEGYAPVHNHTIIVSYGDTYVGTKAAANKLNNGKFAASSEPFLIKNSKIVPVSIRLQAEKLFPGESIEAGQFEFVLRGNTAHGTDYHETVKNDASGAVTFSPILFDEEGTYEYTISEVAGTDSGIVYDNREHNVRIVITKNSTGTKYKAEVTVDNAGKGTYEGKNNVAETIQVGSFTNAVRGEGIAELKATKSYSGGSLAEGDFEFKIEAVTTGAPMPSSEVVSNTSAGNVNFGEIRYSEPGEYKYRITETEGNDKSIVYDTDSYIAVVTVTAPADLTNTASLKTDVKYFDEETNAEVAAAAFVNKDRAVPELTMKGYKSLDGEAAADGKFSFAFQEIDPEGNPVGTETIIDNGANGKINFDQVLEDVVNDLVADVNNTGNTATGIYKIYEKAGTDAGIIYDDTYYVLQVAAFARHGDDYYELGVVLQKVDGENIDTVFRIEASDKIDIADAAGNEIVTFANTSSAELKLEIEKDLITTDSSLQNEEFVFILEGPSGKLQEKTITGEGTVQFDAIEFTKADIGEHSYVIYEKEGDVAGLYYDDSIYTVTVTVATDADGRLTVSSPVIVNEHDTPFSEIVFVNKDIEPAHLHLKAHKTVNGEMPTVAQTFRFQLIDVTDPGNTNVIDETHNVHGEVAFKPITFGTEGTYNYIIKEVIPADKDSTKDGVQKDGFTYDETVHTVKVVVTDDNNDGVMEKKVFVNGSTTPDPAEHNTVMAGSFNNTYETDSVKAEIKGTKNLEGKTLGAEQFSFVIEAVTADAPMPEAAAGAASHTVKNDAAGDFTFGNITFTKAGIYKYTVSEVIPEEAVNNKYDRIIYDDKVYDVTVTVTDNGKGKLIAETTVNGSPSTEIDFVNRYEPDSTAILLTAEKTLTGRTIHDGEFSFRLVEVDGADQEIAGTEQVVNNGSGTGTDSDKIYFNGIRYDKPGTHTYKISEVIPAEAVSNGNVKDGVTYDTSVYTVIVTVEDENGALKESVTSIKKGSDDASSIAFANNYEVTDTEAVLAIKANKSLSGMTLAENMFTFQLEAITTGAPMPDAAAGASVMTVSNAGDGTINFGQIKYGKEHLGSTFQYEITEIIPVGAVGNVKDDMHYDGRTIVMSVKVTDDGKGSLVTKVNGTAAEDFHAGTFSNAYIPTTGVTLSAKKVLNKVVAGITEPLTLTAGQFAFHLTDDKGNLIQSDAVNAADGSVIFDTLTYTEAGEYIYKIHEAGRGTNAGGIDYSDVEYTVKVVVTAGSDGKLSAQVFDINNYEITPGADHTCYVGEFINILTPGETHEILHGFKKMIGGSLAADAFEFQLKAVKTGAPMPEGTAAGTDIVTVKNDASGMITFGAITFDNTHDGKSFVYEIKEVTPGDAVDYIKDSIGYDQTVYNVRIDVTESGGNMIATAYVKEAGQPDTAYTLYNPQNKQISFTNVYHYSTDGQTAVVLSAEKILEGEMALQADMFEFVLTDKSTGNTIETVKNLADGSIVFSPLVYDTAGTYVYSVSEVPGTEAGITYTTAAYDVTVEVADDGTGKLAATVNSVPYDGNPVKVGTFVNYYGNTSVIIEADKILNGRDLKDGEFEFILTDITDAANPVLAGTAKNIGGKVRFYLSYEEGQAGTYTYEISEVNGGSTIGNVTYDSSKYTVTIKVVQEHQMMKAYVDDVLVEGPVYAGAFSNTYEEPVVVEQVAAARLEALKVLEGRTLEAGEFEFQLKDSDGKVLQTKTNAADGKIKFNGLYYLESAAGTYYYTINEVAGDVNRVIYDETVYNITVKVGYNLGTLVADVFVDGAADKQAVFTNVYDPVDAVLNVKADKQYFSTEGGLHELKGGEFTFQMKDSLGNVVATASNNADGTIAFGPVSIETAGTHLYYISEVTGGNPAVTYWDETVYTVEATVAETEPGVLNVVNTAYYDGEAESESLTFFNEGGSGGSGESYEDLDDGDTPHAGADAEVPETGDDSNMLLWLFIMMASVFTVAGLMISETRSRKN